MKNPCIRCESLLKSSWCKSVCHQYALFDKKAQGHDLAILTEQEERNRIAREKEIADRVKKNEEFWGVEGKKLTPKQAARRKRLTQSVADKKKLKRKDKNTKHRWVNNICFGRDE